MYNYSNFLERFLRSVLLEFFFVTIVIWQFVLIKLHADFAIFGYIHLILIFYFAIIKPYRIPRWFIFLMGLFQDAFLNIPLGINPLTYIILIELFLTKHSKILRFSTKNTFLTFLAFAGLFILIQWITLSIYYGNMFSIFEMLMQFILTSCLFMLSYPVLIKASPIEFE